MFKRKTFSLILIILSCSLLPAEVNIRSAVVKSALVPGWGELSLNNKTGYAFLTAEIALWAINFYYNQEIDIKDKASRNYAIKYAGVDPTIEFNEKYLYHIHRYISSGYETGGYNAKIVQQAINLYPDDPVAQTNYIEANVYDDDHYWYWENTDRKYNYSIMRKRINQYEGYLKGISGVIIANHLFSALNTLLLANKLSQLEFSLYMNENCNTFFQASYRF
jgi:hypothetical protein